MTTQAKPARAAGPFAILQPKIVVVDADFVVLDETAVVLVAAVVTKA